MSERAVDVALAAFDKERMRVRQLEEALWHIAKRPMEKDVADDANESRRLARAAPRNCRGGYPMSAPLSDPESPPATPCEKCGRPRTKAEGGTVFTVCDDCWPASESVDTHECNRCGKPAPPLPPEPSDPSEDAMKAGDRVNEALQSLCVHQLTDTRGRLSSGWDCWGCTRLAVAKEIDVARQDEREKAAKEKTRAEVDALLWAALQVCRWYDETRCRERACPCVPIQDRAAAIRGGGK